MCLRQCFSDSRYHSKTVVEDVELRRRRKILEWLSGDNFTAKHRHLQKMRVENSGKWFLDSENFTNWAYESKPYCLVCAGIRLLLTQLGSNLTAGAGKSILM